MTGLALGLGTMPDRSAAERSNGEGLCVAALVVLGLLVLSWRWIGYQGHDDAYFAAAAMDWVRHYPALGTDHWALRYTLVLPIAAVIALTGPSVLALAVVNLAAYVAFLVVHYAALRHWFGWKAAAAVALIGILVPAFPVQATYANPDLVEMTLVVASVWCLVYARERGGPWPALLLSGVLAGLALVTRETAILLLPFFGLLFLLRPAMPRWRYLLIAAGFAAVVGGQMGYFAARTGDPLYRARISATHDQVDRAGMYARAANAEQTFDSEGVLAVPPAAAPFGAVLASQKFGLLFYLAIPAYIVLRLRGRLSSRQVAALDCASLGALVSFLFVALNAGILYVVPRYFMVTAALAAVPVAVLAAELWDRGRRGLVGALALVFALSCTVLLYLENTDPLFAEHRIVELAATAREPLHVDPETAGRARYLLTIRGLEHRVTTAAPAAGALVASKEGTVESCLREPACGRKDKLRPFRPDAAWVEIDRKEPAPRLAGGVLRALGLDRAIPPDVLRKVERPSAGIVLFRVPAP